MKMNKKGFTLAELLIVIAIMAILIAIAIPVFSSQLENARHAVDEQAARSAKSIAESHYLLSHSSGTGKADSITCTFQKDDDGNLSILKCTPKVGAEEKECAEFKGTDASHKIKPSCQCDDTTKYKGKELEITVDSNGAVSGGWKS